MIWAGRRSRLVSALVVAFLGLLAACGPGPQPRAPTPTPPAPEAAGPAAATPTPVPTLPPPTPEPAPLLSAFPAPDASEVPTDTWLVLRFAGPLVPLGAPTDLPDPSPYVTIDPPTPGRWRWLGTNALAFEPQGGWQPATAYRVSVAADAPFAWIPPEPWGFSTVPPRVLRARAGAEGWVAADSPVVLTWSQPVRPEDLAPRLTVEPAEPLELTWSPDRRVVTVTASSGWQAGQTYRLRIDAGVRGVGGLASEAPFELTFQGAPPFRVLELPSGEEAPRPTAPLPIRFTQPVAPRAVAEALQVDPPLAEGQVPWGYAGEDGRQVFLYLPLEPGRTYTLTLPAGLESRLGERLGEAVRWTYRTPSLPPALRLEVPGTFDLRSQVALAGRPVTAYVRATNLTRVTWTLTPLTLQEAVRAAVDYRAWQDLRARAAPLRRGEVDLDLTPNEPTLRALDLGTLPPGPYLLQVFGTPNGRYDRRLLFVVEGALTLKAGGEDVLVWGVDPDGGTPLAGALLTLAWGERAVAQGRLDAAGLWQGPLPPRPEVGYAPLVAWTERPFALVLQGWEEGISPWTFNLPVARPSPFRVVLTTDRPLYRPGETVRVRGWVRSDEDGRYRRPGPGWRVELELRDPFYETVLTRTLSLDPSGAFEASIALPPAGRLGPYTLLARVGRGGEAQGEGIRTFSVREFRTPVFEVTVDLPEAAFDGEILLAEARARYLFGAPVADAPVTWRIAARPYLPTWRDGEGNAYDLWDPDLLGEGPPPEAQVLLESTDRTDAQGTSALATPLNLRSFPLAQELTVEAEVRDPAARTVAGRGTVVVHKADLYLALRPESWVVPAGEGTAFRIRSLNARLDPLGGVEVGLQVLRRTWVYTETVAEDGTPRRRWIPRDRPVLTETVRTDAEGWATLPFTPTVGGEYRLVARATDGRGRPARSATRLWAWGGGSWRLPQSDRLTLIPDRDRYRPGQTARLLLSHPYTRARALITLERGRVRKAWVQDLTGPSALIQVPLTGEDVPNLYVSVVLIPLEGGRAGAFKVAYAELPVEPEAYRLRVEVEPEVGTYAPGERSRWRIRLRDAAGRPVRGTVAVALVDEGIYLLQADPFDLFQAFFSDRPLSVELAQTLTHYPGRLDLEALYGRKGGGGGGGAPSGPTQVRRRFAETAYWQAFLEVDGEATLEIPLPEDLTAWRLTVWAEAGDDRFGQGTGQIQVRKPLLVRPWVPAFLVTGDQAALGGVVQNLTEASLEGTVELRTPAERFTRTLRIPAGGARSVTWTLTVGPEATLPITLAVEADGLTDAVAVTVPVRPPARPEVQGTAGRVEAGEVLSQAVRLPADADPRFGELRIFLEPDLGRDRMGPAARFLADYPYACSEQLASRILGLTAVRPFLDPDEGAEVDRAVEEALARLEAAQVYDGGWSWWPGEGARSQPLYTAYAVEALQAARAAGFAVPDRVLQAGLDYLEQALEAEEVTRNPTLRAWILERLLAAGRPLEGSLEALLETPDLPPAARAHAALAWLAAGRPQRAARTLEPARAAARPQGAGEVFWPGAPDLGFWVEEETSTALVLRALLALDPEAPEVEGAVRWLEGIRRQGRWRSTFATARTLQALAAYASAREAPGGYRYTLQLDGRVLASGAVEDPARTRIPPLRLALTELAGGAHRLLLGVEGEGSLPYRMELEAVRTQAGNGAWDHGFAVARRYLDVATGEEVTGPLALGQVVTVEVTLLVPEPAFHVVVEDSLPAGLEGLDPELATTPQVLPFERQAVPWWEGRAYDHVEIRAEGARFFAGYLPPGTYVYRYLARATQPGRFRARPARAYRMYNEDVWGRSWGVWVEVR